MVAYDYSIFWDSFFPGDPASITLGLYASDETIAALRQELGLD